MKDLRSPALPVESFPSQAKFRAWLKTHHTTSPGIWLKLHKKASGQPSLTYAEALEEALCFGWIDGQKKPFDADSWLQRVTPRRPKSNWSQVNTRHVERLIAAGRMTPAGLKEVERAKSDGRWERAYASSQHSLPPADFLEELEKHPPSAAFYRTLNKANVYAIVYRLQTAKKPETRAKRMTVILEMLKRDQTFHPQGRKPSA